MVRENRYDYHLPKTGTCFLAKLCHFTLYRHISLGNLCSKWKLRYFDQYEHRLPYMYLLSCRLSLLFASFQTHQFCFISTKRSFLKLLCNLIEFKTGCWFWRRYLMLYVSTCNHICLTVWVLMAKPFREQEKRPTIVFGKSCFSEKLGFFVKFVSVFYFLVATNQLWCKVLPI